MTSANQSYIIIVIQLGNDNTIEVTMRKLFAAALVAVTMIGCSSRQAQPEFQLNTVCFVDDVFHESAGQKTLGEGDNVTAVTTNEVLESKTKRCTNKPGTEHIVKDVGFAKTCRPYFTSYRIRSQVRHVKSMMCQFPDGSWQQVDGRHSYFK